MGRQRTEICNCGEVPGSEAGRGRTAGDSANDQFCGERMECHFESRSEWTLRARVGLCGAAAARDAGDAPDGKEPAPQAIQPANLDLPDTRRERADPALDADRSGPGYRCARAAAGSANL